LNLLLHPAARADLVDIWQWTAARWGVEQAETYLKSLQAALNLLRTAPEMARERQETTPPLRLYTYRSHLLIYRLTDDALTVHRMVHARSDWNAALSD
jgi:toxin ParE1/3/4